MLLISSRISPECVYINPAVDSKEDLLKLMVEGLASVHDIADKDLLYKDVLSREELCVTALGLGCAVPHALSAAMDKTLMAAAILNEGIDFKAPDDEPVTIVLMMVGPESGARIHLKLLSKIARLLHIEEFRQELLQSKTPEDFLGLFADRER
jgi:mannitol/fructose-specific phosphotransferase system IIA component (Ntr-type)